MLMGADVDSVAACEASLDARDASVCVVWLTRLEESK